ncbi:MAG: DUF5916 domain-containing protein [Gammaproteobacteria bacterium]
MNVFSRFYLSHRRYLIAGLYSALSLFSASALAQTTGTYSVPRVANAPSIDGQVTDSEWAIATRITVATEFEPGDSVPAQVSAEALIMEDGETLFVAFIAEDPNPELIRAFYRDRDSLWDDDWMGIVLDTFNDERRAYQFLVNPLGVQADSIQDDINNTDDDSWNAIWDSEGRITASGWEVEMSIPLKQLRFSPAAGEQVWGVDAVRHYPRDRRNRIAMAPRDRDVSCYLCQISKAQGFANLDSNRNLQIVPTLTSSVIESRNPAGNGEWEGDGFDADGGLDVRWGITQDMYLNATLNPDFSQVEADSAQLDINNTFSLFFPERRDFFLDGADYFDTSQNLVHTRNIANPDYGAKITGKTGNHTFGLLSSNDESTSFLIPGALRSSVASLGEVNSDVNIGRYRFDIFSNSSIGALVTDRQAEGYQNTVTSIDAVLRPTDQDTFTLQSMHSSSDYPTQIQNAFNQAASMSDSFQFLEYRHNDRNWDIWVAYSDVGTDFRADLGFVNRVDYKYFVTRVGHTWRWGGDNFLNRFRVALDYDKTEDQSGFELEEEFEVFLNIDGPLQSRIDGLFGGSKTYWNGQYFDEQFNQLSIDFSPVSGLELGMLVRVEDIVDFANTRLGRSVRFGPEVNYRFGRHLELDLEYQHQQFDVDGGRLFTAELFDAGVTYQFNNRAFLRYTAQYTDNERNPALYVNSVQRVNKELSSQLLYSYKVNAVTRFFVGYSDGGFQNDSFNSIEHTDRAIFAKFSYAWLP